MALWSQPPRVWVLLQWLGEVTGENVRGNGGPPRRDLGQFVRFFIVLARDVVKLEPAELVFEATHCIAVCLHLLIVAASLLHHLVDVELGVSPDVETFDAEFDGDAEAAEEGLVFHHVVRRREVQAHHVPHVLSEG